MVDHKHLKGATVIAQFDYAMDVVSRRTNRVEQLTSPGASSHHGWLLRSL